LWWSQCSKPPISSRTKSSSAENSPRTRMTKTIESFGCAWRIAGRGCCEPSGTTASASKPFKKSDSSVRYFQNAAAPPSAAFSRKAVIKSPQVTSSHSDLARQRLLVWRSARARQSQNSGSTSPLCAILMMRFAISSRATRSVRSSSVDIALS